MIEKTFVKQGLKKVQLHQYLKRELHRAGFTGFDMVKTPLVTRIVVHVSRPGLAIGKGGQNIRALTETIKAQFGVENPQLEIKEITTPDLDAKSVCDRMKNSIERGFSWRSVAFRTINDIERAGAQGLEVILTGKLAGKGGRKRKVRFVKGYMKKVGDQTQLVDEAKVTTYPKVGAIGVTVRIIRPGVFFPDKIDLKEALAGKGMGVTYKETARQEEEERAAAEENASEGEGAKESPETENAEKTEGGETLVEKKKEETAPAEGVPAAAEVSQGPQENDSKEEPVEETKEASA